MLKRKHRISLDVRRVLPLRNEQLSPNLSGSLALPTPVGFSTEAIIIDALAVTADLLWIWKVLRAGVPAFIFRVFILSALFLLMVGSYRESRLAIATTTPLADTKISEVQSAYLQIRSGIKAADVEKIVWPVPKTYISTYFSASHLGIDLPEPYGTKVRAFTSGSVIFTGWDSGFGKTVIIKHNKGYVSRYSHLAAITVRNGQEVSYNTTIGLVGATGVATGPHLHFEIYKAGLPINPLSILR